MSGESLLEIHDANFDAEAAASAFHVCGEVQACDVKTEWVGLGDRVLLHAL